VNARKSLPGTIDKSMRNFREFVDAIEDKPFVAKLWRNSTPKDEVLNDPEIWRLVSSLSEHELNVRLGSALILGRDSGDVAVYEGPISDGLLKVSSPLLKKATGKIVGSPARAVFYFAVGPQNIAGSIMIAPPPLIYKRNDLAIMFGIVSHELRHAADFASLNGDASAFHTLKTNAKVDMQAYSRNIMEARAFAEQISQTLRLMGGRTDLAIEAVEKSMLMSMTPADIRKVARMLLEEIAKENLGESFDANPPAVVRGVEEEATQKIVRLLGEIIERLSLSNNVKGE